MARRFLRPAVANRLDPALIKKLIPVASTRARAEIVTTLRFFGEPALQFMAERGVKIRPLANGEQYADVSPYISSMTDIASWPHQPAGLFVVGEETAYLRDLDATTIAHELGHGLDFALGFDGKYRSDLDAEIRHLFSRARKFVSGPASVYTDEYFAEGTRAFLSVNSPPLPNGQKPYLYATSAMLRACDPHFYALLREIFKTLEEQQA